MSKLVRAYHEDPDHLIVVHDELDIDPGTVRVKFGGGHAGTTACALSATSWERATGIACAWASAPAGTHAVVDWVLSKPKKDAADDFAQATDRGAQAALSLVQVGLEKTQQAFN